MSLHKNITFADGHVIHSFEYANAAARTGATGLVSADVSKVAKQTDNNTYWILTAATPTWSELTGASSSDELAKVSSNDTTAGYLNGKLVAGTNITLTENNDGGNETLTIAASGGGSTDLRDLIIMDHFVTGNTSSDAIGSHGWRQLSLGTGADITLSGEAGHPGILDLGSGTTASGRVAIYVGESGGLVVLPGTSQNQIDIEFLVRLNSNALSSANCDRVTFGFGDQWGAAADTEHTNGIYMEYRPADNANFRLTTASGGTRTKGASTTAPTAGNWYRIGLRITFPGGTPTAALLINGTVAVTQTTNIPTAGLGVGFRIDGAATSNEPRVQCDYVYMTQVTAKET